MIKKQSDGVDIDAIHKTRASNTWPDGTPKSSGNAFDLSVARGVSAPQVAGYKRPHLTKATAPGFNTQYSTNTPRALLAWAPDRET
jgi:hypothetical protein